MKKYAMWTIVGLMCMAPAAYAQDTNSQHTDPATGAAVHETGHKAPGKKMARGKHGKKVKPLSKGEQKEIQNLKDSSDNSANQSNPVDSSEVK